MAHAWIPVRTMDFQHNIKQWICVHAADAVYHQVCSINFRMGKQTPLQFLDEETQPLKQQKKGKPNGSIKAYAFIKVVDYLQSHDHHPWTHRKRKTILPTDIEPYGIIHSISFWRSHLDNLNQWEVECCNIPIHCRFNHNWVLQAA